MGINIKVIHIPGHAGLKRNIKADRLAKDTAFKIASGGIAAPVNISATTAFIICIEIFRKSWQRLWDNEPVGRFMHDLIPLVGNKILFPEFQSSETLGFPTASYFFTTLC